MIHDRICPRCKQPHKAYSLEEWIAYAKHLEKELWDIYAKLEGK